MPNPERSLSDIGWDMFLQGLQNNNKSLIEAGSRLMARARQVKA